MVGCWTHTMHWCRKWFWSTSFSWKTNTNTWTQPTVTRSCPMELFLFQKLEKSPKGTHFQSSKDIYKKTAELLRAHPQNDFRGWFEAWKACIEWCVYSDGNYFKWAIFRTIISLIKHDFGANHYIIQTLL